MALNVTYVLVTLKFRPLTWDSPPNSRLINPQIFLEYGMPNWHLKLKASEPSPDFFSASNLLFLQLSHLSEWQFHSFTSSNPKPWSSTQLFLQHLPNC